MYTRFYSEVKNKKQVSFSNPQHFFSPSKRLRFRMFVAEWDSGIQTAKPQTEKLPLLSFFQLLSDDDNWKRNFLDFPVVPLRPLWQIRGGGNAPNGASLPLSPVYLHFHSNSIVEHSTSAHGFKFWFFVFFFLERKGPSLHWEKDKCLECFEEGPDFVVRLCFKRNQKRCFDIRNRNLKIIMK